MLPRLSVPALALAIATAGPAPAQRPDVAVKGLKKGVFETERMRHALDQYHPEFDPEVFQAKIEELMAKARGRQKPKPPTAVSLADEHQIQEWFATCDRDEGGWISYREAVESMGFNRGRFQAFDVDRDARLDAEEFKGLYVHAIASVGHFATPGGEPPRPPKAPTRTPVQLRNAYDANADRHLDLLELAVVLTDYARDDDVELVLASLDDSEDELLSVEELTGINAILFPIDLDERTVIEVEDIQTIAGLFGEVVVRAEPGEQPNPPLIVGPVGHFRRLDLDDDGYISVQDLETLLRPARSAIRPHTVINTLDLDGDMRLTEDEMMASVIDVDW